MIVIPASLRSDFIHMAGMTIHIALESSIHIAGIRSRNRKKCLILREIPAWKTDFMLFWPGAVRISRSKRGC